MFSSSEGLLSPESFQVSLTSVGTAEYVLRTLQFLRIPRAAAFSFFEDPRNLKDITPEWLNLTVFAPERHDSVFEGAEFCYTIHWLGKKIPWKARIVNYDPPREFTDIQVIGPYRRWEHRHLFRETRGGTEMTDEVIYSVPFAWLGAVTHHMIIRRQLLGIFRYRAVKIKEWVELREREGGQEIGGGAGNRTPDTADMSRML